MGNSVRWTEEQLQAHLKKRQPEPAPIMPKWPVIITVGNLLFATELALRTVSLANQREHWAKRSKRVKAERQTAGRSIPRQQMPCIVRLTRIAPRLLDDDNLRGALKGVRDGIADSFGIDDRDKRVAWQYEQTRRRPKDYAVLVEVFA